MSGSIGIGDRTVWKLIEAIRAIEMTLTKTNNQLGDVVKQLSDVDRSLMRIEDQLEERNQRNDK
jgi:hypothetical protein